MTLRVAAQFFFWEYLRSTVKKSEQATGVFPLRWEVSFPTLSAVARPSNRPAACSRHVGCFFAAFGEPRLDPGPREAGGPVQNAEDAGSRWSPSGEDGGQFRFASAFSCFPQAQHREVGRGVILVKFDRNLNVYHIPLFHQGLNNRLTK